MIKLCSEIDEWALMYFQQNMIPFIRKRKQTFGIKNIEFKHIFYVTTY